MTLTRTLLVGSSLLIMSGCAGTQENLRINAAQERLATAYKDKNTVDRGQADLNVADTALVAAQENWRRGRKEKAAHQLAIAQTSLDIADTRGLQAKAEQEAASMSNQMILADKQSQLNASQAQLRGKQSALNATQDQLADSDQQLRDAKIQMQAYDMKETEQGSTLVLRDVVFETGQSNLRAGAANRLVPMINYLKLNGQTRVRIEGHTDNVGSYQFNEQLSLRRATAVKSALTDGGIEGDRIETVGSGFNRPVGSNKTVSGRESNRRVEITLLK